MNPTLTKSEPQPVRNGGGGAPRVEYATPPANILESKDGYVLEAEMPGVSKDGLEVTVENGELTIVGRRTAAQPNGREVYRESRHFDFRRSFELDPSIDTGNPHWTSRRFASGSIHSVTAMIGPRSMRKSLRLSSGE